MVKSILTVPDSRLKVPCSEIGDITDEIRQLANDLGMTMYANHGLGLAANQIGSNVRLIVVGISPIPRPLWLINPTIVTGDEQLIAREGCLSVPGLEANISRSASCMVSGRALNGKTIEFEATGLTCQVIQHEIDHLDGKTILDRLPKWHRSMYFQKLEKRSKRERKLHIVHSHELRFAG